MLVKSVSGMKMGGRAKGGMAELKHSWKALDIGMMMAKLTLTG